MIAFLTVCYVALLYVLLKLNVIKLTLWWKISPAVWLVFLLIVLFIPMQWGAPSGSVTVFQTVVEIIPNVSGQVIEVPAVPRVAMKKGDVLFKIDPRPFEYRISQIEASLQLSKLNLSRAEKLAERDFASRFDVDRYAAEVKNYTAQLNNAKFDLEQTTVRAPDDGFALAVTLRPGQRVANLPLRSWVAYVNQAQTIVVAGINQIMLRHVQPGDSAEITFKLLPGRILKAKVIGIAFMTPQGQLQASGLVPLAPTGSEPPAPYGVAFEFEEKGLVEEILRTNYLPGGAIGTAAIYTESVRMTHVIRKVMIRMEAWMNFINPY